MRPIYNGALRDLRDLVTSYPLSPAQSQRLLLIIEASDQALAFKAKYDEALAKAKSKPGVKVPADPQEPAHA